MAKHSVKSRKGDDGEPLSRAVQPYRRHRRNEPDPTPPEVAATLKDCRDLGACGRALKQTFPQWSEEQRVEALRSYLTNLQIRWGANRERRAREALSRDQDERLAAELVDALAEIADFQRDKFELEEQLGALEDEIAELKHRPTPGR
jgi:hypothetical protein